MKKLTILFLVFSGCFNTSLAQNVENPAISLDQLRNHKNWIESNLIDNLKQPEYFSEKLNETVKIEDLSPQLMQQEEIREKIRSLIQLQTELEWIDTRAIRDAMDAMKKQAGGNIDAAEQKFAELNSLLQKGFSGIYSDNKEAIADAQKALKLKREILLQSADVNTDKFLTVEYILGDGASYVMGDRIGVPSINWGTQLSVYYDGFNASIKEVSGLKSGDITSRTICEPRVKGASFADLTLHWDGDKFMFTTLSPERKWQIYEMNMDGSGLRQVIQSEDPDLEFFDPAYLPDGRIIAVSNMGYHGVPCNIGMDRVGNMVIYDPKTKGIRRLTFDQDANWNPIVKANGKLLYTRWEYADLMHYYSRFVMHMNPDGTEQKALYGSGSLFPNSTFDIKPLPEKNTRFVGVITGHHGVPRTGRLIIFDPEMGRKEEKGMVQEMPFSKRKIIPVEKDNLVDDVWPQFTKPYPLTDQTYLVTAKLGPNCLWGVYLVDIYDNLTLLYNATGSGMIYSIPVKKLQKPATIPDKISPDEKEATVFIQDIYEGEGLKGVPRGEVKAFRVYAFEWAYADSKSDFLVNGIQSGWDMKRLIGTVPVEEDGSAIFKVPANTPISLQPLDSEGRAIQWMRSWLTGMPGEVVSCVGCHEDQSRLPIPKKVIASGIKPHNIKIAEGGIRSYKFAYEIQPILDRACVACHDGNNPELPDFKDTTTVTVSRIERNYFYQKSYMALHPYISRQGPEADMFVMTPYEYHASTSELVRMLEKGHHNVKLTDDEWDHLYTWIDLNAPCVGEFEAITAGGIDYYDQRIKHMDKYANGMGVDWRKEMRDYAQYLRAKGPVTAEMPPAGNTKTHKEVIIKGWPISPASIKTLLASSTENRKELRINDSVKITFVKVPAGKFIMGSNDGWGDEAPAFAAEVKKSFWMSEQELTNAQYNALVPEHDSRIYAQLWKDHTKPGYPANKPNQPVVRVSYEEAMGYCSKLSESTGLKVTLPTEAQWEWACRAGSDKAFWFGEMNADFGPYENLADVQLENLAVSGVDPQPMDKNDPLFNVFNFTPKISTINDGQMLPSETCNYKPNPFGLKNMHGSLAEWTRSAYTAYPYGENSGVDRTKRVVARGGSWIDRPKNATASVRKPYLPWQKVNNVGVRLIIEE